MGIYFVAYLCLLVLLAEQIDADKDKNKTSEQIYFENLWLNILALNANGEIIFPDLPAEQENLQNDIFQWIPEFSEVLHKIIDREAKLEDMLPWHQRLTVILLILIADEDDSDDGDVEEVVPDTVIDFPVVGIIGKFCTTLDIYLLTGIYEDAFMNTAGIDKKQHLKKIQFINVVGRKLKKGNLTLAQAKGIHKKMCSRKFAERVKNSTKCFEEYYDDIKKMCQFENDDDDVICRDFYVFCDCFEEQITKACGDVHGVFVEEICDISKNYFIDLFCPNKKYEFKEHHGVPSAASMIPGINVLPTFILSYVYFVDPV